jgi:hypothetical protein
VVKDKYQGVITIRCPDASVIEEALAPDNLRNMEMRSTGASLIVEVSAPRLGTLISTVDDLLMNAKIACDLAATVQVPVPPMKAPAREGSKSRRTQTLE